MNKLFSLQVIFLLCSILNGQTKTFVREYTYSVGEADSKITSRAVSLDQVKRILLEEIGVYIQSTFETQKEENNSSFSELTKQQIQSITAGVTETKILEERWNGETFYIKANITVDPKEVTKNIASIAQDQQRVKDLEEAKRDADDAVQRIHDLQQQLAVVKDENERAAKRQQYITATNTLSAIEWVRKGINAGQRQEYDNAILFFQKALELDPTIYYAYSNLGNIFFLNRNYEMALKLYNRAFGLSPHFFSLGSTRTDKLDNSTPDWMINFPEDPNIVFQATTDTWSGPNASSTAKTRAILSALGLLSEELDRWIEVTMDAFLLSELSDSVSIEGLFSQKPTSAINFEFWSGLRVQLLGKYYQEETDSVLTPWVSRAIRLFLPRPIEGISVITWRVEKSLDGKNIVQSDTLIPTEFSIKFLQQFEQLLKDNEIYIRKSLIVPDSVAQRCYILLAHPLGSEYTKLVQQINNNKQKYRRFIATSMFKHMEEVAKEYENSKKSRLN
ncbi:MAG: tetratricopeptide repeat protein [Bacteroidota bacterium]